MNYKLLTLFLITILTFQKGSAQQITSNQSLIKRIDNYLNTSIENGYSGSVLVAKEGEIILSKGYGWANKEQNIKTGSKTIYNIGSVSKQFTAAAVLKLVEQNKLKTTDKIDLFFDKVPIEKKDITIHQLLTHTSGISPRTGGFRYDTATKKQFLSGFYQDELMYAPGTKHHYANANYILLSAIIETVSNQEYESFLRTNFWNPLHMQNTGYKRINTNSEFAHGRYFHYSSGEWRDWGTTQDHLPQGNEHWYSIGKGDIYSTVEDLFTWHKALEENQILKQQTIALLETPYVSENEEKTSFYGYGWAILNSSNNTKIVTHNGSNGIFFSDFIRFVEEDIVIISLSNVILNNQSERVGWEIYKMINDKEYQTKPIPKNKYELVFDFMKTNTTDKANQLTQFVKNKTGTAINDMAILNRIGFNQVSKKQDSIWGIALLKLNTEIFPNDGNLWDSLGEGYYLLNDTDNAISSFEKALELKSENNCHWCENSENKLKKLKE